MLTGSSSAPVKASDTLSDLLAFVSSPEATAQRLEQLKAAQADLEAATKDFRDQQAATEQAMVDLQAASAVNAEQLQLIEQRRADAEKEALAAHEAGERANARIAKADGKAQENRTEGSRLTRERNALAAAQADLAAAIERHKEDREAASLELMHREQEVEKREAALAAAEQEIAARLARLRNIIDGAE
jgi:chromosome segregation ATPase